MYLARRLEECHGRTLSLSPLSSLSSSVWSLERVTQAGLASPFSLCVTAFFVSRLSGDAFRLSTARKFAVATANLLYRESILFVDLTMATTNVDPMAHAAAPVSEEPVCSSIAQLIYLPNSLL
jgi:L-aminopeptidase/D-esterase-like protein